MLLSSFHPLLRVLLSCTLFPYTPLFRSKADGSPWFYTDATPVTVGAYRELFAKHEGNPKDPVVNVSDRKSTRLNSSHLVISYAVFCLKKKCDAHCDETHELNKGSFASIS